jgi:hypothetical protein
MATTTANSVARTPAPAALTSPAPLAVEAVLAGRALTVAGVSATVVVVEAAAGVSITGVVVVAADAEGIVRATEVAPAYEEPSVAATPVTVAPLGPQKLL